MNVDRRRFLGLVVAGVGASAIGCLPSNNQGIVRLASWEGATREPGNKTVQIYAFPEGYSVEENIENWQPHQLLEQPFISVSDGSIGCNIYHGSLVCSGGLSVPNGYSGVVLKGTGYFWNPLEEGAELPIEGFDNRAITGAPTWTAVDRDKQMLAIVLMPTTNDMQSLGLVGIALGRAVPEEPAISPVPLA